MSNTVWVVEMWNALYERWEPTVGTALTRDDGRQGELRRWGSRNPDDRFRLTRYEPAMKEAPDE